MFSFLVGKPRAKFPARAALGIKRLVASRPIAAIARLARPKTTGPPVSARIETKKASASAMKALPARTVRRSRVPGSDSPLSTTVKPTNRRPRKAAAAPVLAMKKLS